MSREPKVSDMVSEMVSTRKLRVQTIFAFIDMYLWHIDNAPEHDPVTAICLWGPKVLLAIRGIGQYGDSPQWYKWYVIVHTAYIKALLDRSESTRQDRICLNNL